MTRRIRLMLCIAAMAALSACSRNGPAPKPPYAGIKIGKPYEVYGRWYNPQYNAHYDETGIASWYGPGFHGGRTANGERFDQNDMTAAHKTLPMPSIVRVTNLDNGLSAIVKVNDRGPFSHDRIIDLSRGVAKKLDVIRTGTARVRVQFLDLETREYVQNMQNNGTEFAMNEMKTVDPVLAGEREEQGSKPVLRIGTRMFGKENAPAAEPNEFAVVDNSAAVSMPSFPEPSQQAHYTPVTYHPTVAPAPAAYHAQAPVKRRAPAPAPAEAEGFASPANTGLFIQAGTFVREQSAMNVVDQMSDSDAPQVMQVVIDGKRLYRVMVGPLQSRDTAKNMLSKLASLGISDAKIIHN